MLYPLKFRPMYKERIWGGAAFEKVLGKTLPAGAKIGESWEISGLEGDLSVVAAGRLEGNDIEELTEVFMGELVGDGIYNKFGMEFPLLIKFLDADQLLSIQVHPDDALARERHHSYGKDEMWYVVDAEPGAFLYLGFNKNVTYEEFAEGVRTETIPALLNKITVSAGDAFYVPAGTIHSMGKGIVVAEIQQASDITYRLYDWGRTDAEGNPRELHTDLAMEAINFGPVENFNVTPATRPNQPAEIVSCEHFTVNKLPLDGRMERDHSWLDSFVIYMCIDGRADLTLESGSETLGKGETVLVPAGEEYAVLEGEATLLEIYIKQ